MTNTNDSARSSSKKNPFLVFEGLDGSGKSTLIQSIADALRSADQGFVLTREPGGTPLAESIRQLLLCTDGEAPVATTELLLYAASRSQHVAGVIQPALKRGDWVLCDRFVASSVAFQCFARGLPRENVDWLNSFAVQGSLPDLTILLDLTVEESQRRQSKRRAGEGDADGKGDRMERESLKFHESVRQGYLAQAKEVPERWLVVDAHQSPEAIQKQVLSELKGRGWLA